MKKNTALFKLALVGGALLAMTNSYANDDYDSVCTTEIVKVKYYGGDASCSVVQNGRRVTIKQFVAPQLPSTAHLSNGSASCTANLPLHHVEQSSVPVCSLQARQPFLAVKLNRFACKDGEFSADVVWQQSADETYELEASIADGPFEPLAVPQITTSEQYVAIAVRLRATKNGQIGSWSYVRHNVNCRGGKNDLEL